MTKRILAMFMFAACCLLLSAAPALPHGGGGGTGGGTGGGGGSGSSAMQGFTTTQVCFCQPNINKYTVFSQGVHDQDSAVGAIKHFNATQRGPYSISEIEKEQFVSILVSTIAWVATDNPAASRLAMIMEAMIQEGKIKPSQAMILISMLVPGVK